MKKFFALLLTGLFLFNLSGYYFVFKYNQFLIRSQVRVLIRSGHLAGQQEVFVFPLMNPPADLKWINTREFSWQGKMYDIVSVKMQGDSIAVTCVNDKNEEALFARFNTFIGSEKWNDMTGKSNNTKAMLYHIIKQAMVKEAFSLNVPYMIMDEPTYGSCSLSNRDFSPPVPPPRSFC